MLTLAISRGRIWDETLPLLKMLKLDPDQAAMQTRQLVIPSANPNVQLLPVRAQDVPTFVASGAAQIGIAGRDVLAEKRMSEIICPLDLKIAQCKLVVATPPDFTYVNGRPLLVATKYPNLARDYFAEKGVAADIVKLHGAMELAPQVGVADVIVDLSASGQTLKENGLVEKEIILQVSAMLIVNQIAERRNDSVRQLLKQFAELV